ncbi:adenylylsulfate reductase subunit B [Desulfofundulus luciae]|nr:adenylylsulfate reductase subunit B [Desulfofundulus luciae]
MSCVKACPNGAIETRLPYQLGYYPAKLIPLVGSNKISWTVVDIHGKVERFTFKNRND